MPDEAATFPSKSETFANQDEILLGVLTAIERDANTSQRSISRELDVALGLANAYLKRCVRKGMIKIQQVPRRRFSYYLTPYGFAEKTRLTGQYLSASFTFFRRSREQISALLDECETRGWKRIAIVGLSDLAEIAILCAHDRNLTFLAVVDPAHHGTSVHNIPVVASLADCRDVEAVILTSLSEPQALFHALEDEIGAARVLAPQILRISASNATRQDSDRTLG